jgi:cytochrome c peroxidase
MVPRGKAFAWCAALSAAVIAGACTDDLEHPGPAPVTSSSPNVDAGPDAAMPLCLDGKPTSAYPPEPYEMSIASTLPKGLVFAGPDGDVSIDAYYEPCAERSRILVVRSTAAWCGTCLWHLENDEKKVWSDPRFAGRLELVDLVIGDEDNMPATAAAAARLRTTHIAATAGAKLGIDPAFTFGPAQLAKSPLPVYVLVDTKTMKILSTASDPDPVTLANKIAVELSFLDKTPRPNVSNPALADARFTENQMDLIAAMKLPESFAPPADPTNEYGDVPAAATLGKKLFEDTGLTPTGTVSCASCHDPAKELSDGQPQSIGGIARLDRNSPAIALAAHSRWQFWDGRVDSLWAQALGPIEDAKEMGSSRAFVVAQIKARYAAEYDAVFGVKHPIATANDTRIFVNVGKAIAAFERSLRVKPNALDAYAAGDLAALTAPQKDALLQFFKVGCAQCHWGPRLSDDAFHNIRFPTGRQDKQPDRGRFDVLPTLATREFTGASEWSDAPQSAKPLALPQSDNMLGAFKTPTLRGIAAVSAPYGHGGMLTDLPAVTKHYGERGLKHDDPHAIGTTEQWVPQFDANVQQQLPAILQVMTGEVVIP